MSEWKGRGFEPFDITFVLKFTTVGSKRNLGLTPTPFTNLQRPSISPTPASFIGNSKCLLSSTSQGVYFRIKRSGERSGFNEIYT